MKDEGLGSDDLSISVNQSGGLVKNARILANLCGNHEGQAQVALATGVILMAGAALEALVLETVFLTNRKRCDDERFRRSSPLEKIKELNLADSAIEDARELWRLRNALTHSEPDHKRSREIGEKLNPIEADRIARMMESLALEISKREDIPKWFKENLSWSCAR